MKPNGNGNTYVLLNSELILTNPRNLLVLTPAGHPIDTVNS